MAWIAVYQGIARHRKTVKLASLLDIPRMSAVGHMISLWHWAIDNAPDGDLSGLSDEMVAMAAEWPEATGPFFVQAIKQAGFVDPDGMLHNWMDYAGKLIDRREADAKRKRETRASAKHPQDSPVDIPQPVLGESAATVQYSTVQNHFIYTLRNIPGWEQRGEPHLATLLAWKEEKDITDDQMERAAIGLSAMNAKTLGSYSNLASAVQVRVNKNYDGGVKLPAQEAESAAPLDLSTIQRQEEAVGLWERAMVAIKEIVTKTAYTTFIAPLEPRGFLGSKLILKTPSKSALDQVMRSIGAIETATGCPVELYVEGQEE